MKTSRFFGKRQVVLAVLIMVLSSVVFLNWKYTTENSTAVLTSALNSTKNLGDAKFVNATVTSQLSTTKTTTKANNSDFFVKSREDRQKARAEALAQLKDMATNVKADEKTKQTVAATISQLAKNTESENSIEILVKSKKFRDCVAIINDDKINVIVGTQKLTPAQTLQIQDIVFSQTKILPENIKIIEVK